LQVISDWEYQLSGMVLFDACMAGMTATHHQPHRCCLAFYLTGADEDVN